MPQSKSDIQLLPMDTNNMSDPVPKPAGKTVTAGYIDVAEEQ
jgi:hypothetical protein